MSKSLPLSIGRNRRDRRGAMLPLIAILLPVMIIFLGFSVDLAYMQNTRMELRAATDVAARAGSARLSRTEDTNQALQAAKQMARSNRVAGKPLELKDSEVEFGRSEPDANGVWQFVKNRRPLNSVRVTGDRSAKSLGGSVSLFFNQFYGSQPFEPQMVAVSTFVNFDICLVLDRSGSMQGQKIEDLRAAVNVFLDELEKTESEEQVALATYATTSELNVKLNKNYGAIRAATKNMKVDGMTAIGLGLEDGIAGVTGQGKRKLATPLIILMTDGMHNTGVEPIVPARVAANEQITVHTISFGHDADRKRMQDVAAVTGGQHYHADTGTDLAEVFREIARSLPSQLTQ